MKTSFSAETTDVAAIRRSRADPARWIMGGGLILFAAIWVAWLGFRNQVMGDYPFWFAPSMDALLGGHVGAFFAHLPTDFAGGSVLIRAPFALIGKQLVGGQHAIFRFGALACVLAATTVGLTVARTMRDAGRPTIARLALVGLFLLTPALLDAILYGHPEEPLGAALCIGAVLLAATGRGELAGGLLGLAIINKPWGVLAIAPVVLAAPCHRWRLLGVTLVIAAGWLAASYLASPTNVRNSLHTASSASVAHPEDLWWPLARLQLKPGVTPWYKPPAFIGAHARTLAVLASIPLAWPIARRRGRTTDDALALLALLLLVRCVLDPSNHVYYQVPFVLAFATWEGRTHGAPVRSLISLGGFWLVFHTVSGTGSLSAQFFVYMALVTPLVAYLATVIVRGQTGIVQQHDRHRLGPGIPRGVAS